MHPDHFIANKWITGTGMVFESKNPADNTSVWSGHNATIEEVNKAVASAREAFPIWAATPFNHRIAILEKFRDEVSAATNVLAEAISKETGKPQWEAKTEVAAMIAKVGISLEAYAQRCPETVREIFSGMSITRHKPHGVIAVFGPFNFPAHLPNGHIVPALLAGNTIIFKPSEMTPLVAEITMQCWEKANLPPGTLNMVQGGRETGGALSVHPDIDGLFFTGSSATGIVLASIFAKHPEKILALEMGGNNPLVVSQTTNRKAAALVTAQSAYLTAGQRCTCARRLILIENSTSDAFMEELLQIIDSIKVGVYTDNPEPFMGPVISLASAHAILAAQEAFKSKDGIPIREIHLKQENSALLTPGLIDVTNVPSRPDEEIFGPLLQLIRVKDLEAAIAEANNTSYGLTAGIISSDEQEFRKFYREVRAGVINWNTPLTGSPSTAPFGGVGRSGNNRPSAFYAADYCSYPVVSLELQEPKLPSTPPPGILS